MGLAVIALFGQHSSAVALQPGVRDMSPVARSATHGRRYAVVIAPGKASTPGQLDANAYATRLQQLGFQVTTIGPSRRFDADAAIRDLAQKIPDGSEVAVFAVGGAYARADDIFILPEDSAPLVASSPDALPTDALSLGLVLRSIARARPSVVVGFIDECRRIDDPRASCPLQTVVGQGGANLISATRKDPTAVGRGDVRDAALRLMTEEGASFAAFYEKLDGAVGAQLATLSRTAELSTSFMFVPDRFFESLQTPCNDNATDALQPSAAQSRFAACNAAFGIWSYAPHFARAKSFSEEQVAFSSAWAGPACTPVFETAAQTYRTRYPSGAFIPLIERAKAGCPTAPARVSFTSQTGWSYSYDGELLYVSPDGNDRDEFPKTQVSTTLHSRKIGTSVAIYVQVLANVECLTPETYLSNGKVGKRTVRIDYSERVRDPPQGYYGWALSGRGFKLPNQQPQNLRTLDIVVTRIGDRNQYLHVGGRFPSGEAEPYIDEVLKIFHSATPPAQDRYRVPCPN